jgi:hypothetical protein
MHVSRNLAPSIGYIIVSKNKILKGEIMTTATQEITVRVSRSIQFPSGASQGDQFDKPEPLLAEVVIREACPKKKYSERLDELLDLASEKVFGYLDSGEDVAEGEEIQADGGEGDELLEEGGEEYQEGELAEGGGGFEGGSDGGGKEGFEESGEEEFQGGEESQGEEGGEEGFEGGEGEEEEFGDFFDDDPGGTEE